MNSQLDTVNHLIFKAFFSRCLRISILWNMVMGSVREGSGKETDLEWLLD